MIEVNYIPDLPLEEFRNGHGAYEGIVMHSTAVYGDNDIGERSYECTHHNKAFVHAFSDPHGTLEVADPNYVAWGAGHVANQRYLHSELCQVKNDFTGESLTLFKASYGNWIDYAAQKLYDRRLGVSQAQSDGSGTLWQHYEVTEYLGDSTHVDPMDYLQTWSVTWDQVISDVQNKYKELERLDEVLARLKVLEDAAAKIPAPPFFVEEFKSADLGGLIHDPLKTEEFWETVAVLLRAMKWQPAS